MFSSSLQQQLVSLLEILNTTEPHYIRCIMPNNLLKPGIFENKNVLQQLRCGVRMTIHLHLHYQKLLVTSFSSIRMTIFFCDLREWWRQSGLVVLAIPLGSTLTSSWIDLVSLLHKLWTKSKMSLPLLASMNYLTDSIFYISSDEPAACKKLLDKAGLEGYQVISLITNILSSVLSYFYDEFTWDLKGLLLQIGKTKVFLRAGQMADLDTRRTDILGRSASIIQRKVRSYLATKTFMQLRSSATQIQAVCRGIFSCLFLFS